jgi:hypothetical protein
MLQLHTSKCGGRGFYRDPFSETEVTLTTEKAADTSQWLHEIESLVFGNIHHS